VKQQITFSSIEHGKKPCGFVLRWTPAFCGRKKLVISDEKSPTHDRPTWQVGPNFSGWAQAWVGCPRILQCKITKKIVFWAGLGLEKVFGNVILCPSESPMFGVGN
jgi:hypothetical protein